MEYDFAQTLLADEIGWKKMIKLCYNELGGSNDPQGR